MLAVILLLLSYFLGDDVLLCMVVILLDGCRDPILGLICVKKKLDAKKQIRNRSINYDHK